MEFLEALIEEIKKSIQRLMRYTERYLAETTVTRKVNGQELTSSLIEVIVRRAVAAVIKIVATALAREYAARQMSSQTSRLFIASISDISDDIWRQ